MNFPRIIITRDGKRMIAKGAGAYPYPYPCTHADRFPEDMVYYSEDGCVWCASSDFSFKTRQNNRDEN